MLRPQLAMVRRWGRFQRRCTGKRNTLRNHLHPALKGTLQTVFPWQCPILQDGTLPPDMRILPANDNACKNYSRRASDPLPTDNTFLSFQCLYARIGSFLAFLCGPKWCAQMEKSACARRVHKRLEKGRLNEAGPANSHK